MRRVSLRSVVAPDKLLKAFKQQTWQALRRQACLDLFGYYDYNLTIHPQARRLSRLVVSSLYKAQPPIQIELTKNDLLVRRMQLPHPDDATLMTAIANYLEPIIKKAQPSKKAYYGRSDSKQTGIHLMNQSRVYNWSVLWPIYQKQLLQFARRRKLIVTTDIQNFFDSINISILRNNLAVHCGGDELPNFVLYLFEAFAVRDRYAPFRNLGIPTIDSDLPRIAAHCLLFEIDAYLNKETTGSYSRWVDDMNFGVSDRASARLMIRNIERLLFRHGLRLGGGKTTVLDREGVREYVQEAENQYLNVALGLPKSGKRTKPVELGNDLTQRFVEFHKRGYSGSTDKVIRRYYNAFATRAAHAFDLAAAAMRTLYAMSKRDFDEHPDSRFRLSIVQFWLSLPITLSRLNRLLKAAIDGCDHDDLVTAAALQGVADVRMSAKLGRVAVNAVRDREVTKPGFFYGASWVLAKHGTGNEIRDFVSRTYPFWSTHELYSRQVVALWV